ncbi:MAG: leucine-rich repeat protein [Clostridia bacterium]|nr:leucine-rich repeat protein [Clostridia bacterium]
MAIIKCPNCENEIIDSEVVCPYCDYKLNNSAKKGASVSDATGKVPAITDDLKPATSSDFEKEKAAILNDIKKFTEEATKATAAGTADLEKTVKISRDEILSGKTKTDSSSVTATKEKDEAEIMDEYDKKVNKKRSPYTKYIILAVTILGVILIGLLISRISDTISDGINRQKKTNKTVEVKSSAEEIAQEQGFKFSSSTLTIIDEKVMIDYESADQTPWYEYSDTIKHVTISDGITKIGAHSFDGFKNITDVTLSKSVTSIGDFAFYNCTSLKKLLLSDDNELMEIGESAFELCENLSRISGYTKDAKFEPLLIVVGNRAFAHCTSLKEFKLPDDVQLGDDVFVGCDEEFAIICSENSTAHDYAEKNKINVKEDFDVNIIEEEYIEEPEETEEDEEEKEENEETTDNPESEEENNTGTNITPPPSGNSNPGTTDNDQNNSETTPPGDGNTTSSEVPEAPVDPSANKEKLGDLSNKLTGATTPEEEQKILEEMEKYY